MILVVKGDTGVHLLALVQCSTPPKRGGSAGPISLEMEEWGRVLVARRTATLEGRGRIPGVRMVGHRTAVLPDRMEGHTSHVGWQGHGGGRVRHHTPLRRCYMVQMAKGLGPPILELGARVPARGPGWAASLHDGLP
jgi:hypothetical protein